MSYALKFCSTSALFWDSNNAGVFGTDAIEHCPHGYDLVRLGKPYSLICLTERT
jgi:hypothetical protein